ncbi:hypothetical protein H6F98_03545 [Microcoleus sp. FACHB-SPT15]|nr:hypothetical protein [Microcoleus sp. FACHB-SPT15]
MAVVSNKLSSASDDSSFDFDWCNRLYRRTAAIALLNFPNWWLAGGAVRNTIGDRKARD